MHAVYQLDGDKYDATIASIDGDMITVNWSDDDPDHRVIASEFVSKNGVPCLGGTASGTRSTKGSGVT